MVRFIASIIAISLTGLSSAAAWPDQPIKMLVPFAAGGTTDVVARIVAERLGARLGRPLVIENVAGAGGNSGAGLAAKAHRAAVHAARAPVRRAGGQGAGVRLGR